ncbi:very short patch repair endonuclease [Methylorubrum zatmanii]|uniref:Very short patch repair endonuclease n=1 Tax=Methylorubrum zatmanii TaxID=29429 RepID=A0ABW1WNI6_9HYPH|nr:DNA mismatch endonuclease Vsr [Methylorubrum zatmanii]MBD8906918.1 hypothetical protein [Methylorubrum zatmanii]
MPDRDASSPRSAMMAGIRSKHTAPEVAVRRKLHALGFRFSLHRKDLPGRPDIVLPKHRTVVQVHGCYWHGCPHCAKGRRRPATNAAFWNAKLDRNMERDMETDAALRAMGWAVLTIWECRTKRLELLVEDLDPLIVRRVVQGKLRGSEKSESTR